MLCASLLTSLNNWFYSDRKLVHEAKNLKEGMKDFFSFIMKNFCNPILNRIFVYNFGIVMTEEGKKLLNNFETRVRHLIYLHEEQKREIDKLKDLLKSEEEKSRKLQKEIDALQSNYTNLKTASAISLNGSELRKAKLRLSKLVREIDECIALLNE